MSLLRKLLMENSMKPSVITYTSTDGNIITQYNFSFYDAGGKLVNVVSNIYNDGFGKITFGGVVTSIGYYAFYRCSGLTSIEIPSSVTSIGDYAFNWCTSLTNIEIPSGVTSIGDFAFSGCNILANITVLATIPPTLGNNALLSISSSAKIYVPSESVDAYKAATNWPNYTDKIRAIGS